MPSAKRTLRRVVWATALLVVSGCQAPERSVSYVVAISPDGSRVAVAKTEKRPHWDFYESAAGEPLRQVPLFQDVHGSGGILYSPDGRELLFTTAPNAGAGGNREKPDVAGGAAQSSKEILWRRPVGSSDATPAIKVFEHDAISNVLPLLDGSILFMGRVRTVKKRNSPIQPSGSTWTNYSWMMRKPDGSFSTLDRREHAFFSAASLIRDEAAFFIGPVPPEETAATGRKHRFDVIALKPGADLSDLAALVAVPMTPEPRLQCDWSGKTCIRTTTYTKNRYYAHQLEVIRNGRPCPVPNLPDRLERTEISRSGNAIALITRPTPRSEAGYQLVRLNVGADGCAETTAVSILP